MKSKVLVTGGAGYIGSHTVRYLLKQGIETIVLDNLIAGHKEALDMDKITFIEGNIGDKKITDQIFKEHKIEGVIHFAAFALVGESVSNPGKYYQNNVKEPLSLLETMIEYGCKHIIFSSTCATYGNPQYMPLDEKHPQNPINPYGKSKLMLEEIIRDFSHAHDLKYAFLRYFNACGASDDARIGEDHQPETHLIPLILQTALGLRDHITVFGTDYPTHDGTCIRDYIHVDDLAKAHLLSLEYLKREKKNLICNLGTGKGLSVNEIIQKAEEITGLKIPVKFGTRREGDPAELVANAQVANELLNWHPEHSEITTILKSAWKWHNSDKKGKF